MVTYILLTLSILSLWLPLRPLARWPLWQVLFGCALVSGILSRIVHPAGVVLIVLWGLTCYFLDRPGSGRFLRTAAVCACLVLTAVFFLHVPWGFTNLLIVRDVRLSPDTLPYSLYFNFDKPLVGLFLIGLCHSRVSRREEFVQLVQDVSSKGGLVVFCVLVTAVALQFVRLDVKWPSFALGWMWANLFFTCTAEEAFFRGFIQRRLVLWLERRRLGAGWAILAAAFLFGAVHFAGGVRYVFLATVAGLGYGWVYHKRRQIESSIGVHFLVNAVHFVFFSYPAMAG